MTTRAARAGNDLAHGVIGDVQYGPPPQAARVLHCNERSGPGHSSPYTRRASPEATTGSPAWPKAATSPSIAGPR